MIQSYPETHDRVLELLAAKDKGSRVLDLGNGTGELTKVLEDWFERVYSCDIDATYKHSISADLNKDFPFEDSYFDIVIGVELIEHLKDKDHFFSEVRRILKKDGIFIYTAPNLNNIFNRLYYLFKGKFIEFNENELPHHINPFFYWQHDDRFYITELIFNRGFFPILRIPLPNIPLFGQTIITECVKTK